MGIAYGELDLTGELRLAYRILLQAVADLVGIVEYGGKIGTEV